MPFPPISSAPRRDRHPIDPSPAIDRNFFWLSLLLLATSHGSATWPILLRSNEIPLAAVSESWRTVAMAAIALGASLTLAAAFSLPFLTERTVSRRILGSDLRSFATAILGALLAVLLLAWIETTVFVFVPLAASALTKLELRARGIRRWLMFFWLAVAGSLGVVVATVLFFLWHHVSPHG